jgi:hypothetical protein
MWIHIAGDFPAACAGHDKLSTGGFIHALPDSKEQGYRVNLVIPISTRRAHARVSSV